jgi:hypothetical protein
MCAVGVAIDVRRPPFAFDQWKEGIETFHRTADAGVEKARSSGLRPPAFPRTRRRTWRAPAKPEIARRLTGPPGVSTGRLHRERSGDA